MNSDSDKSRAGKSRAGGTGIEQDVTLTIFKSVLLHHKDIEMDSGTVKDGDMDTRDEPALSSKKVNLCQYSGLTRLKLVN